MHLFIDSIHNFDISENDDSVYYFGPGVHNVGERFKQNTEQQIDIYFRYIGNVAEM